MAKRQATVDVSGINEALVHDGGLLKPMVESLVQELLEVEMTEHLGAEKYERSDGRTGYRSRSNRRERRPENGVAVRQKSPRPA